LLLAALREAKVSAKLHTVKDGGHGGFKRQEVEPLVTAFFAKHLK